MKEPLKGSLVGLDRCIERIKDKMDANNIFTNNYYL
jgi:hypothetical protein